MILELVYLGYWVFLLYRRTVNRNLKEKFLIYTDRDSWLWLRSSELLT